MHEHDAVSAVCHALTLLRLLRHDIRRSVWLKQSLNRSVGAKLILSPTDRHCRPFQQSQNALYWPRIEIGYNNNTMAAKGAEINCCRNYRCNTDRRRRTRVASSPRSVLLLLRRQRERASAARLLGSKLRCERATRAFYCFIDPSFSFSPLSLAFPLLSWQFHYHSRT